MIEEGGSYVGQLFLRADLSKGLRCKGGGIPFTSDWHGASTWKQKQNSKVFYALLLDLSLNSLVKYMMHTWQVWLLK